MSDDHDELMGIDEISVCGPTRIFELKNKHTETYMLYPSDFGVNQCKYEDIATAKTKKENALKVINVLIGRDEGPILDFFCVNAAALLYITGKTTDLKKAVDIAKENVAKGKALEQLKKLVYAQSLPRGSGLNKLEKLINELNL